MAKPTDDISLMKRAVREPTVVFAALATILFAASSLVGWWRGDVVAIDARELDFRMMQAELARGSPLTEGDRLAIQNAYVEEQILVREARTLGLEADRRIDDILMQKMLHVLSGDVIQPTEPELEAFYRENRELYVPPEVVTVDELVIVTSEDLPDELIEQLRRGVLAEDIDTDLPTRLGVLAEVSRADLEAIFSGQTAEQILAADDGVWVGPHQTNRGQHWLRVTGRMSPSEPPFEAVREQVRLDWIRTEEEERLAQRVAEIRERYRVEITGRSEE